MGSDSSAQYIHMVQHLIEECIVFNMSQEECMEALDRHANIKPVITSTVWKELEKENKEFFEAYKKKREERAPSQIETSQSQSQSQRIHKILLDFPRKNTNGDDDQ